MELKYTPGPWFQSHRKNGNFNTYGDAMYSTQVYTPDGETIATIHWYPKPKNESGVIGTYRESNAHLIAAAPDLLEALDVAVTSMLDSGYNKNAVVIRKARAAIAKAEGKNQ